MSDTNLIFSKGDLRLFRYPLSNIMTNCYAVESGNTFFVVDLPQGAFEEVIRPRVEGGMTLEALFLTHAHYDHIWDLPLLKRDSPQTPIYGTAITQEWVANPEIYAYGGVMYQQEELPQEIQVVEARENLSFLGRSWATLPSEGHCPGSLSLYQSELDLVFTGDLIFLKSIGRTDLPGGDLQLLEKRIREEIYTLREETTLYPGHGRESSVGYEKRNNPFIQEE